MRYLRFLLLGLVVMAALGVVVALSLPSPKGASGTTAGYPDSMASLGDSFTRAMNPGPSLSGDQPQYSWSTGDDSAIQSHYYRILQQNSGIVGNNFNDAVSGARMVALNGQAQSAVSQGVEYVTILMGSNDVCTPSEATMTAVGTFRSQFQQAMNTLTTGLPNARIFVVSIPDIYILWFILKDNPSAVSVWSSSSICQSLLANPTSTAQADVDRRDRVRQRNIDFNSVLAQECAQYTQCRFDNNAGFNTQFQPIHVSTLDYFHPSLVGQALAASVTWAATYDFSAQTPDPPDVSGSWAAVYSTSALVHAGDCMGTLVQTGTALSGGGWNCESAGAPTASGGTVTTGTKSGLSINGTFAWTYPPGLTTSFVGTLTAGGSSATGTWNSNAGTFGTFSAARQTLTPSGSGQVVSYPDAGAGGASLTFGGTNPGGYTAITSAPTSGGSVPPQFQLVGSPPIYYHVLTTVPHGPPGPYIFCAGYPGTSSSTDTVGGVLETDLQIMHLEGSTFVAYPRYSPGTDPIANIVCASVPFLSEFALVAPVTAPTPTPTPGPSGVGGTVELLGQPDAQGNAEASRSSSSAPPYAALAGAVTVAAAAVVVGGWYVRRRRAR